MDYCFEYAILLCASAVGRCSLSAPSGRPRSGGGREQNPSRSSTISKLGDCAGNPDPQSVPTDDLTNEHLWVPPRLSPPPPPRGLAVVTERPWLAVAGSEAAGGGRELWSWRHDVCLGTHKKARSRALSLSSLVGWLCLEMGRERPSACKQAYGFTLPSSRSNRRTNCSFTSRSIGVIRLVPLHLVPV